MLGLIDDERSEYIAITRPLYDAIRHFIELKRINLRLDEDYDGGIIPNSIDIHMMRLLGFKDVKDCLLNATQATRDTCERFRNPYTEMTWVLYKMLEARANGNI